MTEKVQEDILIAHFGNTCSRPTNEKAETSTERNR